MVSKRTKIRATINLAVEFGDGETATEQLAEFELVVNGGIPYAYNIATHIMPQMKGEGVEWSEHIGLNEFTWTSQNSGQKSQNSGQKMLFRILIFPLGPDGWTPIDNGEVMMKGSEDSLSLGKLVVEGDRGEVLAFESTTSYFDVELPDDVRICKL